MVVLWKMVERDNPEAPDGKDYVPVLRYYRVFNLEQIDEIEKPHGKRLNEFVPIELSPLKRRGEWGRRRYARIRNAATLQSFASIAATSAVRHASRMFIQT
jgi:hypothetical protein